MRIWKWLLKKIRDRYVVRMENQVIDLKDKLLSARRSASNLRVEARSWKESALLNIKANKKNEAEAILQMSRYIEKLHQTIASINRGS